MKTLDILKSYLKDDISDPELVIGYSFIQYMEKTYGVKIKTQDFVIYFDKYKNEFFHNVVLEYFTDPELDKFILAAFHLTEQDCVIFGLDEDESIFHKYFKFFLLELEEIPKESLTNIFENESLYLTYEEKFITKVFLLNLQNEAYNLH